MNIWTNKHTESIYRVQMIAVDTVVGLVALLWKYIRHVLYWET